MPIRGAVLLMFAVLASPVLAQDAGRISAGSPGVDGRRIEPGEWTMRYLRMVDGAEREVGTVHLSIARTTVDGNAALRLVQEAHTPRGVTVDTAVALARSLHPLTHRSHGPARLFAVDFDGVRVTGSMVPEEGKPQTVEQSLDEPAFDGNILDVVFGALPLGEDYRGTIVAWVYEAGGTIEVPFRVTGSTSVEAGGELHEAWELEITYPIGEGRFWVDRKTNQPLRAEIVVADGSKMTVVR